MNSCPKLSLLRLARHSRCWMSILVLILASNHACAQAPAEAARDEAAIWSQWINDTTWMVARIDPQQLELGELANVLGRQPVWLAADVPYSESQPALRLWIKREQAGEPEDRSAALRKWPFGDPEVDGEFLRYSLFVPLRATRPATATSAALTAERAQLREALAATADAPLQCIIIPPEYLRKTVRDLMPELPNRLGGGPTSVLTDGLLWASLTMDRNASGTELKIQSASRAAAERLAERLPDLVTRLANLTPQTKLGDVLTDAIQPEVQNDQIVLKLDAERTAAAWKTMVQQLLRQASSQTTQQQLRQIVLAIHNFHDAHGQFPPPAKGRDEDGKPLLSWRVHLLPFLDETELYARFRLDEPWDSEHNLPLVEQIPDVFFSASVPQGHTVLLAPVGENTIFGGDERVTLRSVTDGTSNTAMIVAVNPERAVPWTAPEDYVFDPADPGAGLAQDVAGHFLMAAGDGSVQQVPVDRSAETLLHLFQMNDGNPVQW